jgi:hypothetical protein
MYLYYASINSAIKFKLDGGKVWLAYDCSDQRSQEVLDEGNYDGAECRPHNNTYGHINHVATQQKLLEALHGFPSSPGIHLA